MAGFAKSDNQPSAICTDFINKRGLVGEFLCFEFRIINLFLHNVSR